MRFYLETARFSEAQRALALGFVTGIYIVRNAVEMKGRDYNDLVGEISKLSLPWLGVELDALDREGIITEIRELLQVAPGSSFHLFTPLTLQTLQALHSVISQSLFSEVNVGFQYICSLTQLLLAVRAGAKEVLLDARTLREVGIALPNLLSQMKRSLISHGLSCQLLVYGVQDVLEVEQLALADADGVIGSWDLLQGLAYHPYTDVSIQRILVQRGKTTS
ncbi:hypothetical protein [Sulfoacidibacillus thermotolerans]|uniref:EAL domain-containing protein n=1 Tax=Sulfoacidibacillus thermotolerans TaxID=1765684 RepID=A0A2U3D9J9_SULT2|nr:hypothetical protein [Sulfoacidibacillus thermotolerans]PWI57957.1 hypothetical protein BM613_06000 [Sulfoacidibacillus thermotolerans]